MTILPKKRAFPLIQNLELLRKIDKKIPYAGLFSYRAIWYLASLLMYGWFLSWIAYDIFFWHKPITQVSMINYVGSVSSMVMVWAGAWLFKKPKRVIAEKLRKSQETLKQKTSRKRRTRKSTTTAGQSSQPSATSLTIHPEPEPAKSKLEETIPTPIIQMEHVNPSTPQHTAECTKNLLERPKSDNINEIPDACLTCQELVQCLSKTKQ